MKALALALLAVLPGIVAGADLNFVGNVGFTPTSGNVRLEANRVENDRSGGRSGTIRMELWATESRYSGGGINGYRTATYRFTNTLRGGYYFSNIRRTVDFDDPPDGTYYLNMLLTEWNGSQYVIRDYVAFNTRRTFRLGLSDTVGYTPNGGNITLRANEIENTRWSDRSGTLKIALWATSSRYSGGSIRGYIMGEATLSPLSARHVYSNIERTVPYDRPPSGTYYVTFTLSELKSDGYRIIDHVNFDNRITIGGGGSGGGGGGNGDSPGFGGLGTTVATFGYMAPGLAPNWFVDGALGDVFATSGNPWIWSPGLNEWIYLGEGRARVSSLGYLESGETRGWLVSSVFGWIHFDGDAYDDWIWTERFGWLWRQFDEASGTTWVWSPATGWLGFAADGSFFLWSINERRWLAPITG